MYNLGICRLLKILINVSMLCTMYSSASLYYFSLPCTLLDYLLLHRLQYATSFCIDITVHNPKFTVLPTLSCVFVALFTLYVSCFIMTQCVVSFSRVLCLFTQFCSSLLRLGQFCYCFCCVYHFIYSHFHFFVTFNTVYALFLASL